MGLDKTLDNELRKVITGTEHVPRAQPSAPKAPTSAPPPNAAAADDDASQPLSSASTLTPAQQQDVDYRRRHPWLWFKAALRRHLKKVLITSSGIGCACLAVTRVVMGYVWTATAGTHTLMALALRGAALWACGAASVSLIGAFVLGSLNPIGMAKDEIKKVVVKVTWSLAGVAWNVLKSLVGRGKSGSGDGDGKRIDGGGAAATTAQRKEL